MPERAPRRLGAAERDALVELCALAPFGRAATGIDWPALQDYIGVSLSPMVLARLKAGRLAGVVPPEVLGQLRASCLPLAAMQAKRQAALRLVTGALAKASIPAIVLKGAALAWTVYPDAAWRAMWDLDLWLPPERLDEAVAALAPHGFGYVEGLADAFGAFAELTRADERILSAPGGQSVELHGRVKSLEGIGGPGFDEAWARSADASLGGIAARVLCPEHQLLHVCLHVARSHMFERSLLHLLDVALVLDQRRDRWDWPALERDWRARHVWPWMLLTLVLARDLLAAPVPASLEQRAPVPDRWPEMRALAEQRLWEARQHALPPGLGGMVRSGIAETRWRWLKRRFVDYYWHTSEPRTPLAAMRDAGRRAWHDLSVKLPGYAKRWYRGSLRGDGLALGLSLEHQRQDLERLVVASGGVGYAAPREPSAATGSPPSIA